MKNTESHCPDRSTALRCNGYFRSHLPKANCRKRIQAAITVVFLLLSIVPCKGRIGETTDECRARYGKELSSTKSPELTAFVFKQDEWHISINISNRTGKAASIFYAHKPVDGDPRMFMRMNGLALAKKNFPKTEFKFTEAETKDGKKYIISGKGPDDFMEGVAEGSKISITIMLWSTEFEAALKRQAENKTKGL